MPGLHCVRTESVFTKEKNHQRKPVIVQRLFAEAPHKEQSLWCGGMYVFIIKQLLLSLVKMALSNSLKERRSHSHFS